MSGWVKCSDRMPGFDELVWLYQKEIPRIFIGCRCDDSDGWLWGRAYSVPHFNSFAENWEPLEVEVDDDYQPTHWMPLPDPPTPDPTP